MVLFAVEYTPLVIASSIHCQPRPTISKLASFLEKHKMTEICTCASQVQRAKDHIQSMAMVSLDDIIVAATQTIAFSRHSHKCPSRCALLVTEVKEALLHIFDSLIDLLRTVVAVYTAPSTTVPADRLDRVPLTMTFGKHQLDRQQSQYLALDIVCRTSRNLACTLQQMDELEGENPGIAAVDGRVLGLSAQITKLVEEVSSVLLAVGKT